MPSTAYIVQALNYWRREHLGTYVGIRYLLQGSSDEAIQELSAWLHRRATTRHPAGYHDGKLFKGLTESNRIEERDCLAAAPSVALAECLALSHLSGQLSFRKSARVYSYLWPTRANSGSAFQYFMEGYQRRQTDVHDALARDPNAIALVTDIKRFYPSVDRNRVREKFEHRLHSSSLDSDQKRLSRWVCDALIGRPGTRGIPIGPPLGHVLGDLALEKVDAALTSRFGTNYFRYVDDIVVVCNANDADTTLKHVRDAVDIEGLALNVDKTDAVVRSEWPRHAGQRAVAQEGTDIESFASLVLGCQLFLALRPASFDELADALRDDGFALPLERMRRVGSYSRFAFWVLSHLRDNPQLQIALAGAVRGPKKLLAHARRCREFYRRQVRRLSAERPPVSTTARRFYIQRVRHVANRALYLLPEPDYGWLLDAIPWSPELTESEVVLKTMLTSTLNSAVQFPGPACRAIAELWRERRRKPQLLTDLESHGEREAAWQLMLGGAATIDTESMSKLPAEWLERFRFASGVPGRERQLLDFSYTDELRSLQMGAQRPDPGNILATRWSDGEAVVLDALSLGGGMYAS